MRIGGTRGAIVAVLLVVTRPVGASGPAPASGEAAFDEEPGAFFVWSGSIGLGAAVRVASRDERRPPAASAAYTGLGQLTARLAAYDHTGASPGLSRFIAVDVSQTLDLGATVSWDMSQGTSTARRRLALGTSGTTAMQLGVAGDGRASWYVKTLLEQRFAAHLGGRVEGAHYYGGAGGGAGLRLHRPGRLVVHVGPIVAGLTGVHDLGAVAPFGIVAVGGDLGLYARPARRLQLAWTARAHHGFFGRAAGVRDHWRTTLDLALQRAGTGKIRSVNVVVIYEGDRLAGDPAPNNGWLSPAQETRFAHALLLGVGIGFGQGE